MSRTVKYIVWALGALILLLAAGIAFFAATFDPNDYKQTVIDLVKEKKQRTLHLDGDIKLAFWPRLGADLGKIAISEHGRDEEFASVQGLKVSLALLPLLHKQLVVDKVYIDGARANIIRYKDGTTNFDDLLSDDDKESPQIQFDIDGVIVSDSAVTFHDEMTDSQYGISELNVETGHVALGTPFDVEADFTANASKPQVDATVAIKGNFLADPEHKHFAAKGLSTTVKGSLADLQQADIKLAGDIDARLDTMELVVEAFKVSAAGKRKEADLQVALDVPSLKVQQQEVSSKQATLRFKQQQGSDVMQADIVLADLKGSQQAIQSSGLEGEVTITQGDHHVESRFRSPFTADIPHQVFDMPKLAGTLSVKDPALPKDSLQGEYAFRLHADAEQQKVNTDFTLNIDNAALKGNAAVNGFKQPDIRFSLQADTLDLNKLLGRPATQPKQVVATPSAADKNAAQPADLSALADVRLQGSLAVGTILYDRYKLLNLSLEVKADGQQLNVKPLAVKFDDSQIKGSVGISRFAKPVYYFDIDIDRLDADQYITKTDAAAAKSAKAPTPAKSDADTPIDLSALRQLNADGELRIGWLKLANVQSTLVRIRLKADDGVAELSPFSAKLYDGSMNGTVKVDARTTPSVAVKQDMRDIAIGPLLVDAIHNDMLSGKGTLAMDLTTQGGTVAALKKSLAGKSSLNLKDGAVKGIDIAGTLRNAKDKLNLLKSQQTQVQGDHAKQTDFSEMSASFDIRNGVAHNDDLDVKAPLFRINGSGDIDIANESLNYLAKPTVVATLKGQGGTDLAGLNGVTVPIKLTGTFSKPVYGVDYSGLAASLAQNKLLNGVGGEKGEAVKNLLGGNHEQAIQSLLKGNKEQQETPAQPGENQAQLPESAPQEKPTPKDKAKEKLNKLLGL